MAIKRTPLKRSTKPISRKTPIRRSVKPIPKISAKKAALENINKELGISAVKHVKKNLNLARTPLPELLREAVKVFNKWIRERDTDKDGMFYCISCGDYIPICFGDAGHYRAGTFAATKFNEANTNCQCITCNRMKDGNEKAYRIRLVNKIGESAVLEIEHLSRQTFKWCREDLIRLIHQYKQ